MNFVVIFISILFLSFSLVLLYCSCVLSKRCDEEMEYERVIKKLKEDSSMTNN